MIQLRRLACSMVDVLPNVRSMSSKLDSLVELSVDNDGICTMTMNRPPVNALNLELLEAMSDSLDEVAKNKYKGIVLTSAFPNVFSAGVDINETYQPQIDRMRKHRTALQNVWIKLFGSGFITTAAINGHSPAGGCILACACEYRAMVKDKNIGINDTIIGFVPPKWVSESLRHVIGSREAELALTTSKMYTTEEALKIGLVNYLAAHKEDAVENCKQFIKKFDRIPSFAREPTKNDIRGRILNLLTEDRDGDVERAIQKIIDPETQKSIGNYLKSMKKGK